MSLEEQRPLETLLREEPVLRRREKARKRRHKSISTATGPLELLLFPNIVSAYI